MKIVRKLAYALAFAVGLTGMTMAFFGHIAIWNGHQ